MKTLKKNLNILLLATSVVLVWRGIWDLADLYLSPFSPVLNSLLSIGIGVLVLYLNNPKQKDISELF